MASKEGADANADAVEEGADADAITFKPVEAATWLAERKITDCVEAVIMKKEIVTKLDDGYVWRPKIIRVDRETLRANPEYTDKTKWPHCECCCPNCCTYRSDHN